MGKVQTLFWVTGLVLELGLLMLFVLRGYSRRFWVFTFLLAFYIFRPLSLVLLSGHLHTSSYVRMAEGLSFADSVLQLLVVAEFAFRFLRERDSRLHRGFIVAASSLAVAAAATGLAAGAFREGMDRAADLTGLLMLFLALWMGFARFQGAARRLAEGFATFEIVWVGATSVRRYASLHHSASLWMAASWTRSGIWIAVLAFWILTFARQPSHTSRARSNHRPLLARRESH